MKKVDIMLNGVDYRGVNYKVPIRSMDRTRSAGATYRVCMQPNCYRTAFNCYRAATSGVTFGSVYWQFNTVQVCSRTPEDPDSWTAVITERIGQGAGGFIETCPSSFVRSRVR